MGLRDETACWVMGGGVLLVVLFLLVLAPANECSYNADCRGASAVCHDARCRCDVNEQGYYRCTPSAWSTRKET